MLRQINGRPILSYTLARISKVATDSMIVVAVSENSYDDKIAEYCTRSGIKCLRTNSDDELIYGSKIYNWDFIVRLDGSDLLIDIEKLKSMMTVAEINCFDFIKCEPNASLSHDTGIQIIRTDFYHSIKNNIKLPRRFDQVFLWLNKNKEIGRRYLYKNTHKEVSFQPNLNLETQAHIDKISQIFADSNKPSTDITLQNIYDGIKSKCKISPWHGSAGPLMIAEIGGNHEGDFEVAKNMTKLAIASGADCIKFQLYYGDALVSRKESPERADHFKKFELSKEEHIFLANMCLEANVKYLASVWDLEMLDWIDPYLEYYKIGSGDMTAWPILEEFAKRGKPILISTGLSSMEEVLQTIRFLQRTNQEYTDPNMLCILQCTSMYPIPDQDANLKVMDLFKRETGLSVGYSDHTTGTDALLVAAIMGADALEFHFTDTRDGKSFRDHEVSLDKKEVVSLKEKIKNLKIFQGSGVKLPQPSEINSGHEISFRRGVYLCHKVKKGEIIQDKDLIFLRPAHGIDARDYKSLVGAEALRDIEPLSALKPGIDY